MKIFKRGLALAAVSLIASRSLEEPHQTMSSQAVEYSIFSNCADRVDARKHENRFLSIGTMRRLEECFGDLPRFYEAKYGIPETMLYGIIAKESNARITVLNGIDDGGAGPLQIQPGIALYYNGRVLNVGSDVLSTGKAPDHGCMLREYLTALPKDERYKLSELDSRFSPTEALETAAHLLADLGRRYNRSESHMIAAYRMGKAPERPETLDYVRDVQAYRQEWKDYLQKMQKERSKKSLKSLR